MDGARSLERRHLIYYLEVYDDDCNEMIGRLVDITTRGIKLVSKNIIPNNRKYSLRMMLPEGYFHTREIHFNAQSIWSSNDVNPDFYDTGFEVINLDREQRKIIRQLIELVGFNN